MENKPLLLEIDSFARTTAQQVALLLAQEQISLLRRLYAQATDALGKTEDATAQEQGLAIYHQIFAADAEIWVSGATTKPLRGTGPDAWADVARTALTTYSATQHLIGSQVVRFEQINWAPDDGESAKIATGRASMQSYLQAWHEAPNSRLRLVLGVYHDELIYAPAQGWQICAMNLEHVSGEERGVGD